MAKWWSEVGIGVCGLVVLGHFFGVSTTLGITGLCLAAALLKLDEVVWLVGGVVVGWCCMAEGTRPAIVGHFLLLLTSRRAQIWELYFRALFRAQLPPSVISEQWTWFLSFFMVQLIWCYGPMLIAAFVEPTRLCRFALRLQRLPPHLRSLAYFITDIRRMLVVMMAANWETTMISPFRLSVLASVCRDVPNYSVSKSFTPPLPNLESAWPLNPFPLFYLFNFNRLLETLIICIEYLLNTFEMNNVHQGQEAAEFRRLLFETNMGRLFYASFRLFLPWAPYIPTAARICKLSLMILFALVRGAGNWAQEGVMLGPGGEGGVGGLWNRRAAADALRDRLPADFATTLLRVSLSPACPPTLQAEAGTLLAFLQSLTLFPINAGDAF